MAGSNESDKPDALKPWYADGLRFSCLRCGDCCRGEPGYVWITRREIKSAAELLDLPVEEFTRNYVRKVGSRTSLIEFANGDCVFWTLEGCRIYPVRPSQCHTFPFWKEYLRSPNAWLSCQQRCPGVNTGAKYSLEEIRDKMCSRG